MNLNEKDVQQVTDYFSLMRLLSEKLDWEINPEAVQDDVTFEWMNYSKLSTSPFAKTLLSTRKWR